jgi:hypothetical protein
MRRNVEPRFSHGGRLFKGSGCAHGDVSHGPERLGWKLLRWSAIHPALACCARTEPAGYLHLNSAFRKGRYRGSPRQKIWASLIPKR